MAFQLKFMRYHLFPLILFATYKTVAGKSLVIKIMDSLFTAVVEYFNMVVLTVF
jgi:hypothetical protein